jgi:hypothetical protein
VLVGKEHLLCKNSSWTFTIEKQELNGGKILISRPTTGESKLVLEKMFVNGKKLLKQTR